MKYIIFETEQQAMDYSHAKAVSMGLGKPENTCQYWYGWRETAGGKWAVQCPEGTETEPLFTGGNNESK